MKKSFVAAAVLAGFVGPSSAATVIDFTANDAITGNVGGVQWDVTAQLPGTLRNSVHGNDVDCGIYDCAATVGGFDVGFGIVGANDNEIDPREAVIVTFQGLVRIVGFAGMLTYFDRLDVKNFETVRLEYSVGGGAWQFAGDADALEGGNPFDTVGLAFNNSINILADAVRFTATGEGTSDDRSFNVTAAGLTIAPVPIPASFPLLLAGIGALGFAARRKQRKSA